MNYNPVNRTFDCEPTLTDSQVLQFCREGYLILKGIVPNEINRRTCDYLEGKIPANPSYIPEGLTPADLERIRKSHEPSTIFLEEWFNEHVLLNPQVAGIMRASWASTWGCPFWQAITRWNVPNRRNGGTTTPITSLAPNSIRSRSSISRRIPR
jgi:sarcosine oxidase delta subunit